MMGSRSPLVSLLLLLVSLQYLASASSLASAKRACSDIQVAIPGRVAWPISIPYLTEIHSYWSMALRETKPACIVRPRSAEEVSTAVKILNKYPDVIFSAKSGGHDPNPGHATAHEGVLIAMRDVSGTTYDAEKGVAYVRPGGEWNDVISALDPHGVAVVGGRLGIVGIGGLLTQGGISFLSAQYGLPSDTITEWETVLPNGTIATIKYDERPDLAVAMRGGGSQFGIVTKFTMEANPIGDKGVVWGGTRLYDTTNADRLYKALHNFVPETPDSGKSAVIFTKLDVVGGIDMLLLFFFYDGPTPPTSGPFSEFLKVPSIIDTTGTQRYAQLLKNNGAAASVMLARISFRTYTIPYVKSHPEMYKEIADKWKEITRPHLGDITHLTSQCSIDFQPFPATIGAQSEKRGGNALGLSGSDEDRLILELQCSWARSKDDENLYRMSREITTWLEGRLAYWLQDEPKKDRYLPFLMNDAMYDQNVTGRYKDYAKFKLLQEEVDPDGVFANRMGGYKF